MNLEEMTAEELEDTYRAFLMFFRSPLCTERNRAWVEQMFLTIEEVEVSRMEEMLA